jgi:hypothetical protein
VSTCLKINLSSMAIVDLMSNVDLLGKIFFILDLNQLKFIYFIYMSEKLKFYIHYGEGSVCHRP